MSLETRYRVLHPAFLAALLVFSLSITMGCQKPAPRAGKKASAIDTQGAKITDSAAGEIVTVYYFHNNTRCPQCIKLEADTKATVDSVFADALKSGRLKWEVVNFEEPGNEHFVNDYKLYAQSVVVSVRKSGKETSWKNLDKIWTLIYNDPAYRAYIASQVRTVLEGTHQ